MCLPSVLAFQPVKRNLLLIPHTETQLTCKLCVSVFIKQTSALFLKMDAVGYAFQQIGPKMCLFTTGPPPPYPVKHTCTHAIIGSGGGNLSALKCIAHNRAKARTTAEHLIMSASVVCVTHAREEDSRERERCGGREGGREGERERERAGISMMARLRTCPMQSRTVGRQQARKTPMTPSSVRSLRPVHLALSKDMPFIWASAEALISQAT